MIVKLEKYRYVFKDAIIKIIKKFWLYSLFPLNAVFLLLFIVAGISLSIIKFWLSMSIIILLLIIYYIILSDEYLMNLRNMSTRIISLIAFLFLFTGTIYFYFMDFKSENLLSNTLFLLIEFISAFIIVNFIFSILTNYVETRPSCPKCNLVMREIKYFDKRTNEDNYYGSGKIIRSTISLVSVRIYQCPKCKKTKKSEVQYY